MKEEHEIEIILNKMQKFIMGTAALILFANALFFFLKEFPFRASLKDSMKERPQRAPNSRRTWISVLKGH